MPYISIRKPFFDFQRIAKYDKISGANNTNNFKETCILYQDEFLIKRYTA